MNQKTDSKKTEVAYASHSNANSGTVEDSPQEPEMAAWSLAHEEVISGLRVDPERGLGSEEARRRLNQYGINQLRAYQPRSVWSILAQQFKSLIVALLVAASAIAFVFGDVIEGWAIIGVIVLNAGIGFLVEYRAVRSMEALHTFTRTTTRVRRDGNVVLVPAQDLVPGDIVHVEGGDMITADMRLLKASRLQADESVLTGESLPVGKSEEPVDASALLAERKSMLYKGTFISRGVGEGVVVSTGMNTELGTITNLVFEEEDESTPLEKRLEQLGRKLILAALGIVSFVTLSGILTGKEIMLMIQTGISLAVAAIPEGLPIVATIALARGVHIMAQRHALVNRLASVETLGATNTIFTDKTGTLTENKMTVSHIAVSQAVVDTNQASISLWHEQASKKELTEEQQGVIRRVCELGALCNTAQFDADRSLGDPLEVALLEGASRAGLDIKGLKNSSPTVREEAFDPELKLMATFHENADGFLVAVKGAPEVVLHASDSLMTVLGPVRLTPQEREKWVELNDVLAAQGARVIAIAEKKVADIQADPYSKLTLAGLVGLSDPPRQDVRASVEQCRAAGIQVVMVTGDQPATARRIACLTGVVDQENAPVIEGKSLGALEVQNTEDLNRLLRTSIFARVSPKQKFDLIELHQKNGRIVAMTGDGVNDAPGLKKADIGIAMGQRGTEVAREAADLVLQDDSFKTIVEAVSQGRVIFGNIRKFAFYLMSCNVSEVMVVGVAALIGSTLPILPLQILFLNLVTDVFPALALGVGKGDRNVLRFPPRDPEEPILGREHWIGILAYGVTFSVSVLGALWVALGLLHVSTEEAVSISFLTLALSQLWHVFNMRGVSSKLFRNEITRNPYVWGAVLLCLCLVFAAVYVPLLADVLDIHPPNGAGWGVITLFSFVPLWVGQTAKHIQKSRRANNADLPFS